MIKFTYYIAIITIAIFLNESQFVKANNTQHIFGRGIKASASISSEVKSTSNCDDCKVESGYHGKSNSGKVTIYGSANAEAVEVAKTAISRAVSKAVTETRVGLEKKAIAVSCGESIAKAIAQTYASVAGSISTTGESTVCSSSSATAKASATAYAEVIVKAFAKASNKISYTNAESAAEAHAISVGTAKAFADAKSHACVEGNAKVDYAQSNFANAIFVAYANACAKAMAYIHGKGAAVVSESDAHSDYDEDVSVISVTENKVEGNGHSVSTGDAHAETTRNYTCEDSFKTCCIFKMRKCYCGINCQMKREKSQGKHYYILNNKYSKNGKTYKKGYKCACE